MVPRPHGWLHHRPLRRARRWADVPRFTSAASLAGCHTRCMRAQAALRIGRLAWLVLGVAAALVPIHASAAAPRVEQADLNGDLGAKVLNDAVTRVRALASMHGRNADWAEQAVRNSVNINAEDAVRLHVADLEAADTVSLLNQVDGRTVPRTDGSLVIHTAGASVNDFPMPF